jgi:hypothetical protein
MLAIDKLIIIVLGVIVLIAVIILLYTYGKDIGEQMMFQNSLRSCCGAFRAANCKLANSIECGNDETVNSLANKLNLGPEQLNRFCDCTTVSSP